MPIPGLTDAAVYVDQQLGILRAVKNKLISRKDEASEKLIEVLGEISKVYIAIEGELTNYLSVHFDGKADFQDDRSMLVALEGGALRVRMEEARGHCHKIGNVYDKYLKTWFDAISVLTSDEKLGLHALFMDLSTNDFKMIQQIEFLVNWLVPEAQKTLDLVDGGQLRDADDRVRAARVDIRPTRLAISQLLSQLRLLQTEFIAVSGTT